MTVDPPPNKIPDRVVVPETPRVPVDVSPADDKDVMPVMDLLESRMRHLLATAPDVSDTLVRADAKMALAPTL